MTPREKQRRPAPPHAQALRPTEMQPDRARTCRPLPRLLSRHEGAPTSGQSFLPPRKVGLHRLQRGTLGWKGPGLRAPDAQLSRTPAPRGPSPPSHSAARRFSSTQTVTRPTRVSWMPSVGKADRVLQALGQSVGGDEHVGGGEPGPLGRQPWGSPRPAQPAGPSLGHQGSKGENGRASEPALFEHDPCSSADSVETRFVLAPALAAPPISAFTAQPRAWGSRREAVSARSVWGVLWGDETLGDSAEVRACV